MHCTTVLNWHSACDKRHKIINMLCTIGTPSDSTCWIKSESESSVKLNVQMYYNCCFEIAAGSTLINSAEHVAIGALSKNIECAAISTLGDSYKLNSTQTLGDSVCPSVVNGH